MNTRTHGRCDLVHREREISCLYCGLKRCVSGSYNRCHLSNGKMMLYVFQQKLELCVHLYNIPSDENQCKRLHIIWITLNDAVNCVVCWLRRCFCVDLLVPLVLLLRSVVFPALLSCVLRSLPCVSNTQPQQAIVRSKVHKCWCLSYTLHCTVVSVTRTHASNTTKYLAECFLCYSRSSKKYAAMNLYERRRWYERKHEVVNKFVSL